jgi:hypothetical protein
MTRPSDPPAIPRSAPIPKVIRATPKTKKPLKNLLSIR